MAGEIIDVDEIQVLLNLFDGRVSIKYPLYEGEIGSIRPTDSGYQLDLSCRPGDFEDAASAFGENEHEMPTYADVVQAMVAAGAVRYTNDADFRDRLETYRKLSRQVLFCPDTNLFYHCFPSQSGIDAREFAIMGTTVAEIESAINHKYRAATIARMKRDAPFEGGLLDELVNQKTKKSRAAVYGALAEFSFLRDRAIQVPVTEPAGPDPEENDLLIVKALRDFQNEAYRLPVLLTADTNMSSLCAAEGVEYFLFEYPCTAGSQECSPHTILRLLYRLAVICGFIKCGPVIIFAEFRGKGHKQRNLKLFFRNRELHDRFRKEIDICRRLVGLGVGT